MKKTIVNKYNSFAKNDNKIVKKIHWFKKAATH